MNTCFICLLLVRTLFITVTNYFNTLSIIWGVHAHSHPTENHGSSPCLRCSEKRASGFFCVIRSNMHNIYIYFMKYFRIFVT